MLGLRGEELEETRISGLPTDQQTFFWGNVVGKWILQVCVCVVCGREDGVSEGVGVRMVCL